MVIINKFQVRNWISVVLSKMDINLGLSLVVLSQICSCYGSTVDPEVVAENISSDHFEYTNQSSSLKKKRFISFSNHESDIEIELDFTVPFMKIPIGGKLAADNSIRPSLDINAKGLITVGTILFLLVAVVPKLIHIFVPPALGSFTTSPIIARIDDVIQRSHFTIIDCVKNAICNYGETAAGQSAMKVIKSSTWLSRMIPVDALVGGVGELRSGIDCAMYQCPLNFEVISKMINKPCS